MKTLRCLFCLCLFHFALAAQQNFDPGYIIKHNQDTVKGYIEVAMESDLSRSVKFKKEGSTELNEYAPADLLGFGVEKNVYRSMRFLNTSGDTVTETAFVKLLVTGEYNLYYYVKPEKSFYLIQKDNTVYFLYNRVTSVQGEIIKEGNYWNILNLISIPCEKLAYKYEVVGFDDKEMADFVLKVDNCISGTKTTSFYQKPKTNIQPVVFVGGLPIPGSAQLTANFTLRITLPRVDNKSSLNIGINYSYTTHTTTQLDYSNHSYGLTTTDMIYSIPLTFQYNFTTSRVQPYFYGGFSGAFFNETNTSRTGQVPTGQNFGLAAVAGIGIEARIASRLFIKADWRYELILQSPAIGISYHF
jgi:hypothetical protein